MSDWLDVPRLCQVLNLSPGSVIGPPADHFPNPNIVTATLPRADIIRQRAVSQSWPEVDMTRSTGEAHRAGATARLTSLSVLASILHG